MQPGEEGSVEWTHTANQGFIMQSEALAQHDDHGHNACWQLRACHREFAGFTKALDFGDIGCKR